MLAKGLPDGGGADLGGEGGGLCILDEMDENMDCKRKKRGTGLVSLPCQLERREKKGLLCGI